MNSTIPLMLLVTLAGCGLPDPSEQGSSPAPNDGRAARIHYEVTRVEGTYGGKSEVEMAATWHESLSQVTCTFDSSGSYATQDPFLSADNASHGLTVGGVGSCPAAHATSTQKASCMSPPVVFKDAFLMMDIRVSGYDDSSLVTIKVAHPPSIQPSCNFAAVLPFDWDLEATTTVGKFREGAPFPVRFVGERTFTKEKQTSKVSWDLTVTFAPKK